MIFNGKIQQWMDAGICRHLMRAGVILCLCVPTWDMVYADPVAVELTREQWGHPLSGREVTGIKPLQDVVKRLIENQDAILVILYPDDDSGIKWATQVVEWLVSLGVTSTRVQMIPAGTSADIIELEIRNAGKQ